VAHYTPFRRRKAVENAKSAKKKPLLFALLAFLA